MSPSSSPSVAVNSHLHDRRARERLTHGAAYGLWLLTGQACIGAGQVAAVAALPALSCAWSTRLGVCDLRLELGDARWPCRTAEDRSWRWSGHQELCLRTSIFAVDLGSPRVTVARRQRNTPGEPDDGLDSAEHV